MDTLKFHSKKEQVKNLVKNGLTTSKFFLKEIAAFLSLFCAAKMIHYNQN